MVIPDDSSARIQRMGRIQAVVQEDFERIAGTDDSYIILNLKWDTPLEQIQARYMRYERFYRPENFHRLGDAQLTAQAAEIRSAISEAMARIQASCENLEPASASSKKETLELPSVGADAKALGDIYFRDGMTYLALDDLNAAIDMLQRSHDYDPTLGVALANLAYIRFKVRPTDPDVVEEARNGLRRAAIFSPYDAEVHALMARFSINVQDLEEGRLAIDRVEALNPGHPGLEKLRLRAKMH